MGGETRRQTYVVWTDKARNESVTVGEHGSTMIDANCDGFCRDAFGAFATRLTRSSFYPSIAIWPAWRTLWYNYIRHGR